MDCLLLIAVVFSSSFLPHCQARITNATVLNLIAWQDIVDEVNRTNTLAQVLKEYLDDIETVESATSHCAEGNRKIYTRAASTLQTELALCVASSSRQRETLMTCVEDKTRDTVSDVRQHITRLKNCVDTS